MKYIQYTLVCIVMLYSTLTSAQYQKSIDKAEELYQVGSYASARKEIAKMKKKANKSLGVNNPYNAIALVKEAKINVGLGELVRVMEPLEQALAMSVQVNGEQTAEHGFILMEGAEVLVTYGHFKLAGEYIENASKAFEASNSLIDNIKSKLDVLRAQVLSGKGFYRQAVKVVNSQQDYYLQRALSTE